MSERAGRVDELLGEMLAERGGRLTLEMLNGDDLARIALRLGISLQNTMGDDAEEQIRYRIQQWIEGRIAGGRGGNT